MPDLLPPNAASSERAIALAVEDPIPIPIRQLWSPTTCPAAQLPWLAWALSVDEWDSTWPEATKRAAIADSIEAHRKKGTVGALRRALQRLGYEVEIDENTGAAYTFKLRFRVREGDATGGAVLDSAILQATALALKQKNVRSYLADTDLLAETDPAGVWIGGAVISGAECSIGAGGAAALPLDGYEPFHIAGWWTFRATQKYKGPIAKVIRASDSETLKYYSIAELAAFAEGTTFKFLEIYSQGNYRNKLRSLDAGGVPGSFDANGIPRMSPVFGASGMFTQHLNLTIPTACIVTAVRKSTGSTDELFPFWILFDGGTPSYNFRTIDADIYFEQSGPPVGVILPTTYGNPTAFGAKIYDVETSSTDGKIALFDGSTTIESDPSSSLLGTGDVNEVRIAEWLSGTPHSYGASIWNKNLNGDVVNDIISNVNSYLNP